MIFLASDHRGFKLKENLKERLLESGFEAKDLGNTQLDPEDDYVDYARAAAEMVSKNENNFGVVICGSGDGVSVVANKIPKVRAALIFNPEGAKQAREHINANVLALGADYLDEEKAWQITQLFLMTPFSGAEPHQRRVEKIKDLEKIYFKEQL